MALRQLLGAPPVAARPAKATGAIQEIGELPSDYIDFVGSYGPGAIDEFLYVLVPGAENEFFRLESQYSRQTSALRELRREYGVDVPYPVHPEEGGLIPWGITDNGDVCFWRTTGSEPNRWSVVIADGRMSSWFEYDGSMSSFLAGVLRGTVKCDVFPDDWPEDEHSFEPLGRQPVPG